MPLTELAQWTAPAGYEYAHGLIWNAADSKFYGIFPNTSAEHGDVFSFDPATGTYATWQTTDHHYFSDICLSGGKFYISCRQRTGSFYGAIVEFDPSSHAFAEKYNTGRAAILRTIKTNDTHMFCTDYTSPSNYYYKVAIANWSLTQEVAMTDMLVTEGSVFDGTYLWGATLTGSASMGKITVADGTFAKTALTGFAYATDDMADDGTYIYIGSENQKAFCKFKKADSTFTVETLDGNIPTACYGSVHLGDYIYFVYVGSPGKILEYKHTDGTYTYFTLASGENTPNEVATDGTYVYVTTYQSPLVIVKMEHVDTALSKVCGLAWASLSKVLGVAKASIEKISSVP